MKGKVEENVIGPSPDENQTDILSSVVQPEVKEFLENMIQMLPKLTNMMQITSAMYDVTQTLLLKDFEATEIIEKPMSGEIKPIQKKVQDGGALVKEAQELSKFDNSKIGMIGMYKMLKDPTVQSNLKMMKALLFLIRERQEKEWVKQYGQEPN
ncbi:hypothetical protein [Alicyclobacillus dauci]|uniref:DUF1641 domain-containing protein n=1 Tax=Alicyclobacillus dauci TaxID=1475485 RepID=A0ABY6Z4E0_9BACL|nr:hypothetical protein [Alicyclobacillus dauci]WAH37513.1 hypothetical protein NZD86_02960 [Alicyclobacillus dauci]